MTPTPSATAWSIAATESPELAPHPPAPLSQQTLYAETRARGAMPLTLPKTDAAPVVGTPLLPPAVDAVCVPWPLKSRGERNSCSRTPSQPRLAQKNWAPTSFLLQRFASHEPSVT